MVRRSSVILAALLLMAGTAASAAAPRVVVRPLEIYNAPDVEALAPGLQAMMASRLSGPGYTVDTAKTRDPGDEAWAVRTTITHLGGVYSVDAALDPVSASGDGTRTYEKAKTPQDLLPALESVASRLKEALARAIQVAPAAALPTAPPLAPTLSVAPAPTAPGAAVPLLAPQNLEAQLTAALRNHRTSPPTKGTARGLVVTDADRDGAAEILLLTEDSIVAYRDQAGELVRAWDCPAPQGFEPKALSAGDIDGNGVPELFVAGADGPRLATQALEWFGSALVPKGDRVTAFLRAIQRPGQRVVLLGMVPGSRKDLFSPGTREFRWSGSQYEETGTFAVPTSSVPLNLNWFQAGRGGELYAAVTDQDERLEIYSPDGARAFEGGDPIKGTTSFLQGEERIPGNLDEDFFRVEGKTVPWTGPDGATLLFFQRNQTTLGRIFNRIPSYSHGQLMVLRWDGLTMDTVAQGPKIPGYIVDLDTGPSPATGSVALYAALVQTEGALFKKVESRVIAYTLPPSALARP